MHINKMCATSVRGVCVCDGLQPILLLACGIKYSVLLGCSQGHIFMSKLKGQNEKKEVANCDHT